MQLLSLISTFCFIIISSLFLNTNPSTAFPYILQLLLLHVAGSSRSSKQQKSRGVPRKSKETGKTYIAYRNLTYQFLLNDLNIYCHFNHKNIKYCSCHSNKIIPINIYILFIWIQILYINLPLRFHIFICKYLIINNLTT